MNKTALVLVAVVCAAGARAQESAWPATARSFPQAYSRRPLTLPPGMVEFEAFFTAAHYAESCVPGCGSAYDSKSLFFAAWYGLIDRVDVGLSTGFGLNADTRLVNGWNKTVVAGLTALAVHDGGFDLRASLTAPVIWRQGSYAIQTGLFARQLLGKLVFLEGDLQAAWLVAPSAELGAGFNAILGFQLAPAVAARILYTAASLSTGGSLNVNLLGSRASAQIICSPASTVDLFGTVGADVQRARDDYGFNAGLIVRL